MMLVRRLYVVVFLALVACGSSSTGYPGGSSVDDGDSDSTSNTTNNGDATAGSDPVIQTDGAAGDGAGDAPGDDSQPPPEGSVPANPLAFEAGVSLKITAGQVEYYVLAPQAYDATHQTPTQLFIYLHGCGGASSDDVAAATNFYATWLGMAPVELDNPGNPTCWDPDQAGNEVVVMAAIADMKTHFNIDIKRILIGGYSSGGDQAYWTALHNAATFAGVLAYNSTPAYEDTTLVSEIANVAWKLNIVHLAHTGDLVYPIECNPSCADSPGYGGVHVQMQMLRDAGFPLVYFERPGLHYDDNTTAERNDLVYPYLEAGLHTP